MLIHKLKPILLCVLICILSLTCACQPTPQSEAVVNRGDSPLDELVLEKAGPGEAWPQPGDRIVWNETKTVDSDVIGEYTVAVSMDVETPSRPSRVPVVLIEPERFDIDFLTKTAKYLLKGDIFEGTPSKQDVTAEILDFKQAISAHTILDDYQDQVDQHLENLNERYEQAADGNSAAKYDFEFVNGVRRFLLKSYPDDDSMMYFDAYGSRFYFSDDEFKSYTNLHSVPHESVQANGIKTTYEQAHTAADEAMTDIFNEPYKMVHSNILDKVNWLERLWKDGEDTSLGQAYVFLYSREYGDFASLYIEPAPAYETGATETAGYTKIYPREYVCTVVDDTGIVSLSYESFSKTVKTINDDVKLMPFADILERFKHEVFYHNLWGTSKADLKITRIDFGMVREPVKDNPDQYMMVPAWNFIGDMNSGWANERGVSIIALNAVNGSVITDYPTVS